ncbi:MAG: isopentenyl-diphosphate Delta-isomerase [Candidatus Aenigmatarchaeota archaeon]
MMVEYVVLVDKKDNVIGKEEKIKAHREGKLHRAFSIFVFSSDGKLLLQRRALSKYHSPGLWSNTCCSHPKPDEKLEEAIHRRLIQEMGFDCPLKPAFSFIYKIRFDNGLWEHELDHVFIGKFDGQPKPNKEEVEEWKWVDVDELKQDMKKHPEKYTYWFRVCLDKILKYTRE